MGIATSLTVQNKAAYHTYRHAFERSDPAKIKAAVNRIFASDAKIDVAHPINETHGAEGVFNDILLPILEAFRGFQRRDYVMIGGEYGGSEWVTTTGYFCGHFENPWLGIAPSNKLEHIRFGEFHRMVDGQIVQSQIFLGVAELIINLGLWPLELTGGYEGVVPGPASQDGIQLSANDPALSRKSADLVEGMLLQLTSEDRAWRPFWDDNMVWYGPGGFGSYVTTDAFEAFQVPFEETFEDWGDGRPEGITGVGIQCKAGDGDYVFLSGWPAITGVHVKPLFGIKPEQKRIFLRDCDWWRCKDGKIIENWCMVDTLHLALQLGTDVLGEIKGLAPKA